MSCQIECLEPSIEAASFLLSKMGLRQRQLLSKDASSIARPYLKFKQSHPLQRSGVSLAFLCRSQDGLGYRLQVPGAHWIGQGLHRRFHCVLHQLYRIGRKACVRKVFHWPAHPFAVRELDATNTDRLKVYCVTR